MSTCFIPKLNVRTKIDYCEHNSLLRLSLISTVRTCRRTTSADSRPSTNNFWIRSYGATSRLSAAPTQVFTLDNIASLVAITEKYLKKEHPFYSRYAQWLRARQSNKVQQVRKIGSHQTRLLWRPGPPNSSQPTHPRTRMSGWLS